MTNLNSTNSQSWFTRERILIGLPVVLGLLVSAGFLLLQIRPVLEKIGELEVRRDELQIQKRNIPLLERRLGKAELTLREKQEQQAILVSLIAGRERIQTFLALLGKEAGLADVSIQRYEPLSDPAPARSPRSTNKKRSDNNQTSAVSTDPMKDLGFVKSSVALQVNGTYDGLQKFLRRMEGLQLLVESSDLSLTNRETENSDEQDVPETSLVDLSLRLSFYDLLQPAVQGDKPKPINEAPS